jgi:hypothetical protein
MCLGGEEVDEERNLFPFVFFLLEQNRSTPSSGCAREGQTIPCGGIPWGVEATLRFSRAFTFSRYLFEAHN